ncbi:hypothetical protein DYB32_005727 [Aphanomyces invadans]|uniref:WW domain-containing protein n=1 Tax=Aphanomyces invadans TaxID=157072 RepID=A0A418ATR1_9STRA|nr:hypothetical protein DYB32_005727 [Aphanomyces invadans]
MIVWYRTLMGHVKKSLKSKHLTRADAVRKIQEMWKVRKARKHLKALLRSVYQRMEDPATGNMYELCRMTETAQWDAPIGLTADDDHRKRKKVKRQLNQVEAAQFIQRAYRRRLAIESVRRLIHKVYRKVHDPVSGEAILEQGHVWLRLPVAS